MKCENENNDDFSTDTHNEFSLIIAFPRLYFLPFPLHILCDLRFFSLFILFIQTTFNNIKLKSEAKRKFFIFLDLMMVMTTLTFYIFPNFTKHSVLYTLIKKIELR